MDDQNNGRREQLIGKLIGKASLNQQVYDSTFAVFTQFKEVLHEISAEFDDALEERDQEVKIEYRDRGKFEAHLHFADDILVFSMHSNVFEFNREHIIWKNAYIKENRDNSYCGIINIYNFLGDSFRYNRHSDEGYLISRIFINKDRHFFVEGKRQKGMRHTNFGSQIIDKEALVAIVETAIGYSLEFDLLVPPYDSVKQIYAEQLNTKFESPRIQTGKRLGYKFNSDDI